MSDDLAPPRTAVERLRAELDRDARLLQSLSPGSDAHRRLSARLEQKTQELLDKEEEKEAADRRMRAAMRAEQARREARKLTPDQEARAGGLLFVVGGAVFGYFAWGSWWLVAAVIIFLVGLAAMIAPPGSEHPPR